MFEEEAEEYAENQRTVRERGIYETYSVFGANSLSPEGKQTLLEDSIKSRVRKESFKAGAEFGYNKAKVEVEESYRESLCNSELNLASVTEQLEELEKANEWHYPSKGEYPIDKTEMLVYFKYADYEYPCKTFGFYNGHFWDTKRGDVSNKEVIAWKEIVLPGLEENEK